MLPRDLVEQAGDVTGKRSPDLEVEGIGPGAPEHHVGFCKQRARAHANRELGEIEIERTAGVEHRRGVFAAYLEGELAVAHFDQCMRSSRERLLEREGSVRRGFFDSLAGRK